MAPAGNHVATTNEKHTLSFISEGLDIADVARAFVEYIASNTDQALRPPAPPGPRSSKWLQDATVSAVNNAFLLGWKIVELRTRTMIVSDLVQAAQEARTAGQDAGPYDREVGDPFWLTSIWRATFSEIATKHFAAFGDQTTAHTFYEPAQGWKLLLPYLYNDAPDYADIGVPDAGAAAGGSGDAGTPPLTAFALYDVTRRALNCLALLQVKPDPNSLLATSLRSYTDPLLAALGIPVTEQDDVATLAAKRVRGIQQLTPILDQLLNAWDGFLRENYYAGGAIPNDATEETAYRAGSALAELSWTLQQQTAVQRVQKPDEVGDRYSEWQKAFAERAVSYIQHQLVALGTVLDDAYYRITGKPKPESTDGRPVPFDPDLPSQDLACINQSLNLWQKAVHWLDPKRFPPSATPSRATRLRLGRAKQAPPSDHPMDSRFENLLNVALVEQSSVWQSLIVGQQTMDAYNVETVMHALVQKVISGFQDEVRKTIWREVRGDTVRTIVPVLGIVIALSIPGLLWLLIAHPGLQAGLNANGLWAVLGVGPAIAGLVGYRSLATPRGGPATTNVAASTSETTAPASGGSTASSGYLHSLMSTIDSTLLAMLQAASTQLRLDLAALNHQVGLSYPLLDCFVESPFINSVRSDYQFMTQVIWDDTARQEEIEGIVRAALGPLGLLISTHLEENHVGAAPSQGSSVVNVSVTDTVKQGQ